MSHPRLLVVAMARINADDTANNGLLLRNLLAEWPRDRLAQIFSAGDNGDAGFFGAYYRLGPRDRRLGGLFYRAKTAALGAGQAPSVSGSTQATRSVRSAFAGMARRLLVDSGLYEHMFRPRASEEMLRWVGGFRPDLVLAQGYNLAFSWLPVELASSLRLPLAYYPTDDWPRELYWEGSGNVPILSPLVRRSVERAARALVEAATVRIVFNEFMKAEYSERYRRSFEVLMHGDHPARFPGREWRPREPGEHLSLVVTGVLNQQRLPLLRDVDDACELLSQRGLCVSVTALPVNTLGPEQTRGLRHVRISACPSHADLPAVLCSADALLLPERFDESSENIRLSLSSKAHLFMLSGRPIVVYSDPRTGVARYAREAGWGEVVDRRSPEALADAIQRVLTDDEVAKGLVLQARRVAMLNHDLDAIRARFASLAQAATRGAR